MAIKKRAKKRVTRRISTPKRASKSKNSKNGALGNVRNKIALVVNNLLLFIAMSLVSFVLYRFLYNPLLQNLFQVMAIVFGFVAVAFLISLLVLVIMKFVYKRR